MLSQKVKVLIVDDSAVMRQLLTQILSTDPQIEVVGTAADPYFAREKLLTLRPDVLTLDVEMPRMDGITFLEELMQIHPMPVVMISSLTQRGGEVTLRALELGAVDFFPKPTLAMLTGASDGARQIIEKVKAAATARVRPHAASPALPSVITRPLVSTTFRPARHLIALGASTGGTEALRTVLTAMPTNAPGIVIAQHMPPGFTASFANRLNSLCAIQVKEAEEGEKVLPGHALIAPGNFHLKVFRVGAEYFVRVVSEEPVNRHRPSVDVLFDSVAEQAGRYAVGAILTGMGEDGARGLRRMRDAGARTIAQDEATCVVFGMPREAIQQGGAEFVLPLPRIAEELYKLVTARSTAAAA